MLMALTPFVAVAITAYVARKWLGDEVTGEIKKAANLGAALLAILSSACWVANGQLGLVNNATAAVMKVASYQNLWAAWFAYGAALLFAPAYLVDALPIANVSKRQSETKLLLLAAKLCHMPEDAWFGHLIMSTEDNQEMIKVMRYMERIIVSEKNEVGTKLPLVEEKLALAESLNEQGMNIVPSYKHNLLN